MISINEQIECVLREIKMRERVYPSFIERKKISKDKAEYELAAMRAVLETLEGLRPGMGRPIPCSPPQNGSPGEKESKP